MAPLTIRQHRQAIPMRHCGSSRLSPQKVIATIARAPSSTEADVDPPVGRDRHAMSPAVDKISVNVRSLELGLWRRRPDKRMRCCALPTSTRSLGTRPASRLDGKLHQPR